MNWNLFGTGKGTGSRIPGLKSGKTRQYLTLGAVLAALYLGLYMIFATSDSKPNPQAVAKASIATTHINAPGEHVDPRDRWIGGAGAKVAEHDTRLQQQELAGKALLDRFAAIEREVRERGTAAAAAVPAAVTATMTPAAPVRVSPPASFPPGTPGMAAGSLAGAGSFPPPPNASGVRPAPFPEPMRPAIGHFTLAKATAPTAASAAGSVPAPTAAPRAAKRAGKTFLPVGFARATLIGGLNAPTGAQAQQEPQPVFLRIKDLAVLPNHFRANIKDCIVIGAGYGDLSAERAYIRLELLSCIRHDGQAIEVKAKGSVFDETGKIGIGGKVINKQDRILTNALFAGVVSGIGQGLQYQATTTTVSPLGSTVTQANAGKEYQAGISTGVGRAMDRLANYLISLAEKMFPVIEVDAGREVDIGLTQGIELDTPLPELTQGDFDED